MRGNDVIDILTTTENMKVPDVVSYELYEYSAWSIFHLNTLVSIINTVIFTPTPI